MRRRGQYSRADDVVYEVRSSYVLTPCQTRGQRRAYHSRLLHGRNDGTTSSRFAATPWVLFAVSNSTESLDALLRGEYGYKYPRRSTRVGVPTGFGTVGLSQS
jgi:hypothetical protein